MRTDSREDELRIDRERHGKATSTVPRLYNLSQHFAIVRITALWPWLLRNLTHWYKTRQVVLNNYIKI